MKKENKTEEEIEAANSFKKMLKTIIICTSLAIVLIGTSVFMMAFGMHNGITRYGTVEEDTVRYTHHERIYAPFSEIGINPADVKEGDRVTLLFDSRDNFLEAMPKEQYDSKINTYLYFVIFSFVFSVVMLVVVSKVMEKTIGKPFRAWYFKEIEKERLAKGQVDV